MRRRRPMAAVALRKFPRQERSRATVDAILEAAARVLVRRGYARTTTNHVAERAGISVGSLYQYFPNKESLVAALHERHARDLAGVMDEALEAARGRSLESSVRALVAAVLRAHLVDPELHRVLEGEVPDLDRFDGADAMDRAIALNVRSLLSVHREEIARRDLTLAATVVIRIVDALIHAAVIDPRGRLPARELERELALAVLGYLRAPARG